MGYKHAQALLAVLALSLVACDPSDQGDPQRDDDGDENNEEYGGSNHDAAAMSANDAATSIRSGKDGGLFDAGIASPEAGRPRTDSSESDASSLSRRDAARSESVNDGGAGASGSDVPSGEHCVLAAVWDTQGAIFEEQVLELTNVARAGGHNCDTEGNFGPAAPLKMEPRLRCSARLHSKYMAENNEFAHPEMQNGSTPASRMEAAGYRFQLAGENIAAGQTTPQQVVDGWLGSDGHCANIMNPKFTELGVGYVLATGTSSGSRAVRTPYWTQNFGRPR